MAANFYTASLYRAHTHDVEASEHWLKQFNQVIEGLKQQRMVDNPVYTVERHMGRGRAGDHDHFFAEWV